MKEQDTEEVMMMMMIKTSGNHSNGTTTCPHWKLYDNPFYQQPCRINLPVSARKLAASFWDLTFMKPVMDTELDMARAEIIELKTELVYERKARKKAESVNKKLSKEVSEERRGREALERVCQELAREISLDKAAIIQMKREVENERKMLRMAEVMREERVQMKMADAKIMLEEKLLELEEIKCMQQVALATNVFNEKSSSSSEIQRDASSPEPENPHIKTGIKGFVEFPRVVRATGSKSRHWGTKLECQKAQLKMLLKQKSLVRSNSFIFDSTITLHSE